MSENYVKRYDVGQIKLDLPYANYIHELPLLSFGDVQHTINLSLVFNSERNKEGYDHFRIKSGYKLNLQKEVHFYNGLPSTFEEENGKFITLTHNGNNIYTFDDNSQRILRKTDIGYKLEFPDGTTEIYANDGKIISVFDKYTPATNILYYRYSENKLSLITYRSSKTISFTYENDKLSKITYSEKEINFSYSSNLITIQDRHSGVYYMCEYTGNSYHVYSADSNNLSIPVYEKLYENSSDGSTVTITDKADNEIINSISYYSQDWNENSYTQHNQVEVTDYYGVKTRYQYNYNDELLYSYEVSGSDVSFSYDRFQGPVTVYKTDNEFNNSGIGIQRLESGLPLTKYSNNQWRNDSAMNQNIDGYYILTGWFRRENTTSNYSINIQNTDSSFVIPKLSPNQWRYFAYKFYHGYATIMINLDGNDSYLELKDLKLSFQKTSEVNSDHDYQTLLEEDVLIHKSSGTIVPIKHNTFSLAGYNDLGNWIYLQDLIKYKANKKKGVNTNEIYYNNGKNIILNATDLFVNYNNSQISISNFDIGRRYFENSNEHLTKIKFDENASYFMSCEYYINDTCLQSQKFDEYFDIIESTIEGVSTEYTRENGLVIEERTADIYKRCTDYADDCITVDEYDLESNKTLSTTKYYLDEVWGGIYKIEMLNTDGNVVSVINDVYSTDMSALLSRKFDNLTNGRSNNIEYSNGNIASMANESLDYTFGYTEGKLTAIEKNGYPIEEHEHTPTTTSSYYPKIDGAAHSTEATFDKYGRLINIDGILTNTYNTNQYYYYIVNSKSFRYFNDYNKSTHGALSLGVEGNDGAGGNLASTHDHIRNETTQYGYYNGQLTAAVTTDNTYDSVIRQETFNYDEDNRFIGNEFYYDYQNSKRVNSVLSYDDGTAQAPTKSNRVSNYSYLVNGAEKSKTENTYDIHKRVSQKKHTVDGNVFTKIFGYSSIRPTSIIDKYGNTVIGNTAYNYDDMGRISSVNNGEAITYEYDEYGQLTKEINNILDKTIQYEYNGIGNIEKVITNGVETTFTYNNDVPDRLTLYNGKTITYNSMGYPVSYDGKTFTWNKGKLSAIRKSSGVGFNATSHSYGFTYNAKGQRVIKTYAYHPGAQALVDYVTDCNSVFTYDNSGRLIHETRAENYKMEYSYTREFTYLYDESGMIGFTYSYDGGTPQTYYYQRNLLGDVVAIYNTSGTKVAGYAYDAWGNCTITNSTNSDIATANAIRYRGYYYDTETGFYYLNSRYYNPEWRRLISPDDTAYLDSETVNGLNLYCYCNNDPVNFVDPSGHFGIWALIGITVGAMLIGGGVQLASNTISGETGSDLWQGVFGASVGAGVNALLLCLGLGWGKAAYFIAGGAGTLIQTGLDTIEDKLRGNSINGVDVFKELGNNFLLNTIGNFIGAKLIPTNPGWFQPRKFISVFTKYYGQKLLFQSGIGAIFAATTNYLKENMNWLKYTLIPVGPIMPIAINYYN